MKNLIRKFEKFVLVLLIIGLFIIPSTKNTINNSKMSNFPNITKVPKLSGSEEMTNYKILEDIFANKVEEYKTEGNFNQYYIPSIQGTYYALYIANILDRIAQINKTSILNFIMGHYNKEKGIFNDAYSDRYLDTIFNLEYYPLNSLLQTNCYAYLSLDLLNKTDLINADKLLSFIWSCYNYEEGGFIGRPYDASLDTKFKLSTLDNTYYAITVLNKLLENWNLYSFEKTQTINFISDLQSTKLYECYFGGFLNDADEYFESLDSFEPNLLSSYYAISTLNLFESINTIRISDFHNYLDNLYKPNEDYFIFSGMYDFINYSNIIGSSLGLELAHKTNFENIDYDNIFKFLLRNRNNLGLWGHSTDTQGYQLIDTFQILRSLYNTGYISNMTKESKDLIFNALSLFTCHDGYSFMAKTEPLIPTIYSIVSSFYQENRIYDLDIQDIFKLIENSYCNNDYYRGFYASCNYKSEFQSYRLKPIEFFNRGTHQHFTQINNLISPKNAFMALKSLIYIGKLDEFAKEYSLLDLLESLIKCQCLKDNSECYGGFFPIEKFQSIDISLSSNSIFFENAYYAIKTMEIIENYYNISSLTNLDFNNRALFNYINNNIGESSQYLYFQPRFASSSEKILEYTYYMIDLLKQLNLFDLDNLKIKNFLLSQLDYTNIKNIYYSYKISELLNFNIEFNGENTYKLISEIFLPKVKEFLSIPSSNYIDQANFYCIVDLAKNSPLRIQTVYPNIVSLGNVLSLGTTFNNLIIKYFGPSVKVILETPFSDNLDFELLNNETFHLNLYIPYDRNNFPSFEGIIKVYSHGQLLGKKNIIINTQLNEKYSYIMNDDDAEFVLITVNYSRRTSAGFVSLKNVDIYAKIYNDTIFLKRSYLYQENFPTYSLFTLQFNYNSEGKYIFDVYIEDDFYQNSSLLFSANMTVVYPILKPKFINTIAIPGSFLALFSLITTIFTVIFIYKGGNWLKIRISQWMESKKQKIQKLKHKSIKDKKFQKISRDNKDLFQDW